MTKIKINNAHFLSKGNEWHLTEVFFFGSIYQGKRSNLSKVPLSESVLYLVFHWSSTQQNIERWADRRHGDYVVNQLIIEKNNCMQIVFI